MLRHLGISYIKRVVTGDIEIINLDYVKDKKDKKNKNVDKDKKK